MNIPAIGPKKFSIESPWGANMTPMGAMTGHVQLGGALPSAKPGESFGKVLMNNLQNVNGIVQRPDALMREAMTTGAVDIHDVMIANSKAELAVSLTAQFTTKVVQAYDRILQIQV